ncbi:MAG: serine--tRNA ligase [Ardenticatenales bacterium]|nr:serine--tRNA ligase [Ardenticatenales bacterium]
MLDLKQIRENPDQFREGLRRLYEPTEIIDELLTLDERRRALLTDVEALRNERNVGSKEIGRIKEAEERERRITAMKVVNERIDALDVELREVEGKLDYILLTLPNMPHESVPVAQSEAENRVTKEWGTKREFDFEPKTHWELAEPLGIIDFERGVKVSGTRFYMLRGMGARLQRALIQWMLDFHMDNHGFTEVYPPFMVKEKCLYGTGQLPKFGENLYRDAEEDFYWVPTAEVPVTNMYMDEVMDGAELPVRHVAYTPCFRREKMSAGRDVRGIKRGHQFDKVEMVIFTKPEESMAELERLMRNAEEICEALEIPYHRLQMVTGDLSFSAMVKYDIEMWAPGSSEYLEVSSCSNFGDFQARRANIRYRPAPNAKPEFVHTLNGSGLALPRTVIGIMENYQQADGSIAVPAILRPYMRGLEAITRENAMGKVPVA